MLLCGPGARSRGAQAVNGSVHASKTRRSPGNPRAPRLLFPVMIMGGPNNQYQQILECMLLARALGRSLVLPPILSWNAGGHKPARTVPFAETFDVASVDDFVKTASIADVGDIGGALATRGKVATHPQKLKIVCRMARLACGSGPSVCPCDGAEPVRPKPLFRNSPRCRSAGRRSGAYVRSGVDSAGGSRRRRGYDADIQWVGRGDAAATTWTFNGRVAATPRRRRGHSVGRPGHSVDGFAATQARCLAERWKTKRVLSVALWHTPLDLFGRGGAANVLAAAAALRRAPRVRRWANTTRERLFGRRPFACVHLRRVENDQRCRDGGEARRPSVSCMYGRGVRSYFAATPRLSFLLAGRERTLSFRGDAAAIILIAGRGRTLSFRGGAEALILLAGCGLFAAAPRPRLLLAGRSDAAVPTRRSPRPGARGFVSTVRLAKAVRKAAAAAGVGDVYVAHISRIPGDDAWPFTREGDALLKRLRKAGLNAASLSPSGAMAKSLGVGDEYLKMQLKMQLDDYV